MNTEMLEHALNYLDMGWCVYPAHTVDVTTGLCSCGQSNCPCPGKHPIGRWTEFQNSRPTKREVRIWFTTMECNIGTVTGRVSGIVVVDADGDQGIQTVRNLDLAPTLTARTGSGGYHLYYKANGPATSRVRALEGVDIRGDGGYVVLPPSLHRSGHRYEWLDPRPLAIYDPKPFDNRFFENQALDPNWSNELFQGVAEGSRSLSAARLSGRYFGMGLSFEETEVLMITWNERNTPPLDEAELMRTVNSVYRKHQSTSAPVRIETFNEILGLLQRNGNHERS